MKKARDPDQIRQAMKARDLTHRELGLIAGCSNGTVGFILAGRTVNPSLARRISRALRRPLAALFQDAAASSEHANEHEQVPA